MRTNLEEKIKKAKNVYFFGIGGIGISAIARMFLLLGKDVSGSDISFSEVTEELIKAGAKISKNQNIQDIPENTELIIYTAAIEVADIELFKKIKNLKIPTLSYSEALGIVSKNKKTIAISGTHGKTTTTAMIAKIFMDAGLDPTVIVGSMLLESKSNYIAGKGEYLIVEADEYRRSFLNLHPHILIINNIDADHLDYYKDLEDVQSAFKEIAKKVPEDGMIIAREEDSHVKPILKDVKAKIFNPDMIASGVLAETKISFPGEHNRKNAEMALAVASLVGIDLEKAKKSISEFRGTWRRFEFKGEMESGAFIYDDYAHNPQKVRACLSGAREMYKDKKIIAVFQPHLFSRTKTLFEEFSKSFYDADKVILFPIYPAREAFDPNISSEMLGVSINNYYQGLALTVKDFAEAENKIKEMADKNSVVILIGAGDIYKLSEKLIKKFNNSN